jgi:hypothetical protein
MSNFTVEDIKKIIHVSSATYINTEITKTYTDYLKQFQTEESSRVLNSKGVNKYTSTDLDTNMENK